MDTTLVITTYFDQYGNTNGRFVAECKKQGKEYIVIKPEALKGRVLYKRNVYELNNSKPKVGFYSSGSHYQILKSSGQTSRLTKSTIEFLERKTSDENTYTGYSKGNKIRDEFNQEQKELY